MNIILAVSGSIAAYKSYDLLRELIKKGHQVKVVLTQGGLKFINADTFKYLGATEVYLPQDDFNLSQYEKEQKVLHIDLARWCEKLIIYPASASTINRLGQGIASDLLGSIFLSLKQKPTYVFPAMNPTMLTHPITAKSIETLKSIPNLYMANTQSGTLICGEDGEGKLLAIDAALFLVETINFNFNSNKILITTGASIAMLDDIRFLTNPSSGLTGLCIAQAFLQYGYSVHILAGKFATTQLDQLLIHPQCVVERLSSNDEFAKRVDLLSENFQLFIASAALCDFEFEHTVGKIKKSQLVAIGQLAIKPAQDILQMVLSKNIKGLKTIGFAAETSITPEILDEKWQRKPTNLLVANIVKNSYDGQTLGFRQEDGNYLFKDHSTVTQIKKMSKNELAAYLVSWYEQL